MMKMNIVFYLYRLKAPHSLSLRIYAFEFWKMYLSYLKMHLIFWKESQVGDLLSQAGCQVWYHRACLEAKANLPKQETAQWSQKTEIHCHLFLLSDYLLICTTEAHFQLHSPLLQNLMTLSLTYYYASTLATTLSRDICCVPPLPLLTHSPLPCIAYIK